MNLIQKIAKNTASLAVANIASMVMGFFFNMYVARYLGVKGFGILSFALAFTAMFSVLTNIGLSQFTIREVARNKSLAEKFLGNVIAIQIILSLVTIGAITVTVKILSYPEQTATVIYIICLAAIVDAFNLSYFSIYQARERMEYVTLIQVISLALRLVGALFAISQGLALNAFALTYLVASVSALALNCVIASRKFVKLSIQFDFGFWKEMLRQSWPFGLSFTFATLQTWASSILLSTIKGNEAVGLYNAALKVQILVLVIPGIFNSAIFPVMSRSFATLKGLQQSIFQNSIKYMVLVAIPVIIGGALLANKIILFVYGNEFTFAAPVLQILMLPVIFIFISSVYSRLFNSINEQYIVFKVSGACLLLNSVLNLVLIPRYSFVGTSIALAVTELVSLTILVTIGLKRGFAPKLEKSYIIRACLAGIAMGIFMFYLQNLNLLYLVPLSTMFYIAFLFVIGSINGRDIDMLKKTIRKSKPTTDLNKLAKRVSEQ